MRCSRCQGMMQLERFCDQYDETGQLCFMGWRCLSCGDVVDPVIVMNRRQKAELRPLRNRPRRRFSNAA